MWRIIFVVCLASVVHADEASWIELFNGRDLSGWHVACKAADRDKAFWSVADGAIVCDSVGRKDHDYVWLMTDREFGDFELVLKVQGFRGISGNSGVQVRSRYDQAAGWLDGPQVDLHPPGPWRCGFIYDETRGVQRWLAPIVGKPAAAKPEHAPSGWSWEYADEGDGWNDVRIVCRGTRMQTFINGVAVADLDGAGILDDDKHAARNVGMRGHIALQLHSGDELKIRFKEIRVRELGK